MRVTLSFSPGFAAFFAACGVCPAATLSDYLAALQQVETGGQPNCGRDSVGDGGRALGPLQIWRAYWQDSGVPGRYEQVKDRAYARRVVVAYARRYEAKALRRGDWESLARLHNAGPNWRRVNNKAYWKRVQAAMRQKGQ